LESLMTSSKIERVGIKCGSFALFHAGHAWMLHKCKEHCDYLIVLVNDDDYIERKKGCLPLTESERRMILSSHRAVDEVHSFVGANEHLWLLKFRNEEMDRRFPDAELIMFHSDELHGRPWLPGQGIVDRIHFVRKLTGSEYPTSVSDIIQRIRGRHGQ